MNVIKGWVAKARALAGTPLGEQAGRFVRLAAVTAATAWVGGGHHLTTAAVWGAVVGGAEVAYRAARPTIATDLQSLGVPDLHIVTDSTPPSPNQGA